MSRKAERNARRRCEAPRLGAALNFCGLLGWFSVLTTYGRLDFFSVLRVYGVWTGSLLKDVRVSVLVFSFGELWRLEYFQF
jgi:hypothetical protein